MPHHSEDDRYLHLPLIQEDPNPDRRKRQGFPQTLPTRGGRGQFGSTLRQRVDAIEEEARARPQPPAGIQPHLVFRVPIAPNASPGVLAERLQELGITVVGIERDGAIIAFRDDANLNEFRQAVDTYARGPRVNPQTGQPYSSTTWDILELVEADQMRLWGRTDRVATRLGEAIGPEGRAIERSRLYVLDVELWHGGTRDLAQQALNELRQLIDGHPTADERLRDDFVGDTLCLARYRFEETNSTAFSTSTWWLKWTFRRHLTSTLTPRNRRLGAISRPHPGRLPGDHPCVHSTPASHQTTRFFRTTSATPKRC